MSKIRSIPPVLIGLTNTFFLLFSDVVFFIEVLFAERVFSSLGIAAFLTSRLIGPLIFPMKKKKMKIPKSRIPAFRIYVTMLFN